MIPCRICGDTDSELHHLMPRKYWEGLVDWEAWAVLTVYLCKRHHKEWHDIVDKNSRPNDRFSIPKSAKESITHIVCNEFKKGNMNNCYYKIGMIGAENGLDYHKFYDVIKRILKTKHKSIFNSETDNIELAQTIENAYRKKGLL